MMDCGPAYEIESILGTNFWRRNYAVPLLTVSLVPCNSRKDVKTVAQQPDTNSCTIDKGDTVGYGLYERRSGYLVLPLAVPEHSLATQNSITGRYCF